METTDIALITLALLIALVGISAFRRIRDLSKKLKQAETQIGALTDNLNALCSSAVGVDHRVSRLERNGRALESRQENVESHQRSDRPYTQAIQMVQKGATAERLMDELDLSRSEAELLFMLHGTRETMP